MISRQMRAARETAESEILEVLRDFYVRIRIRQRVND